MVSCVYYKVCKTQQQHQRQARRIGNETKETKYSNSMQTRLEWIYNIAREGTRHGKVCGYFGPSGCAFNSTGSVLDVVGLSISRPLYVPISYDVLSPPCLCLSAPPATLFCDHDFPTARTVLLALSRVTVVLVAVDVRYF